jgi:hypothetical protein
MLSTVAQLSHELHFVSDSQDVDAIREHFAADWAGNDYDAYFVGVEDGDYTEVWGMVGIVPYLSKLVRKLV